ncbi:MAG: hypothetical protein H7Y12_00565, partial [Sphingobacteriaceae bacterium]|nr:hypothetical protein [Cytophagaceae bacterium]
MIHEIKPAYLLAYGGLFWVVCVALFPGTYKDVDPLLPGTLLLLTYFASFTLGLKSYRISSAAPTERVYSP